MIIVTIHHLNIIVNVFVIVIVVHCCSQVRIEERLDRLASRQEEDEE